LGRCEEGNCRGLRLSDEQAAIPDDESLVGSVEKIRGFQKDISKWEKEIEQAKVERDAGSSTE